MKTFEEIKKEVLPEYQKEFYKLGAIALDLEELGHHDIVKKVIKKMVKLKMLINHCQKNATPINKS